VLIVIPLSFSSGALSIEEKSRIEASPLAARTFVIQPKFCCGQRDHSTNVTCGLTSNVSFIFENS
jgi:hypothetical protein